MDDATIPDRPVFEVGQLRGIAAFLSAFETPDLVLRTAPRPALGFLTPSRFTSTEAGMAFLQAAYDLKWVRDDFNWGTWSQTPEAAALRDDRDVLASAGAEQLAKLLTVLIRQDRFAAGELDAAFDSGLLTAIVRRAAALATEAPET